MKVFFAIHGEFEVSRFISSYINFNSKRHVVLFLRRHIHGAAGGERAHAASRARGHIHHDSDAGNARHRIPATQLVRVVPAHAQTLPRAEGRAETGHGSAHYRMWTVSAIQ